MDRWRRITFSIPESSEEDLVVCLHENGSLGVEGSAAHLLAYFPADVDIGRLIAAIRAGLGSAAVALDVAAVEMVPDGHWHERWLEGLGPMPVGTSFLIVPGPTVPADTRGRRVIRLVPGRAFGTGEHATTRMCLELLETRAGPGVRVLDIGTGSGILAIAARMKGAAPVTAIDIDPQAVDLASRNAAGNDVAGIRWIAGSLDAIAPGRDDLILANLEATALKRLMRGIAGRLAKEAIVSGILFEETGGVIASATEQGLVVTESRREGDWVCLVLAST